MWPYSYDSCDLGTFPNQTARDGTPAAAASGALGGGPLSFLPGQRLSACTCPGSDHPGPSTDKGRGVPEIDVLEVQVDVTNFRGQVSQSTQTAPFNYQYQFPTTSPATTIYDSSITSLNTYKGGTFQQALSTITYVDSRVYNNQAYAPYAFEWWSDPDNRDDGYITWYSNGARTWTITSAALGPDTVSRVQQRLIPEEPMVSRGSSDPKLLWADRSSIMRQYIVLNLGLSRPCLVFLIMVLFTYTWPLSGFPSTRLSTSGVPQQDVY